MVHAFWLPASLSANALYAVTTADYGAGSIPAGLGVQPQSVKPLRKQPRSGAGTRAGTSMASGVDGLASEGHLRQSFWRRTGTAGVIPCFQQH